MCSTRYGGPRDVYENHRIAAKARGRDAVKGWKESTVFHGWSIWSGCIMGRHRSPWTSWKAGYFQQLPQLRRRPLMVELPLMNLIEYAAVLQELPLRSPCMVSYFCSLFFWHSWCKSSKVGCQITWSRGLVMPGFCGKAQPIRLRELCGGVVKAISSIFLVPQKEPLAVRACLRLQVGFS